MADLPAVPGGKDPALTRFLSRVRESVVGLLNAAAEPAKKERTPSVMMGSLHLASCAATTDYSIGSVLPIPSDLRVRVLITCGATGATFQLTHGSDTYSWTLSARESVDITLTAVPGIQEPYYVQSNTGSIDFSAFVFVPSIME